MMKNCLFLFLIIGTNFFNLGLCSIFHFGADSTSIENVPYFVQIYDDDQEQGEVECVGAIVSNFYILTTAHCFTKLEKDDTFVISGGDSYGSNMHIVEKFIRYDRDFIPKMTHDIGLIKLKYPMKFTEKQMPIKIRSTPLLKDESFKISGFDLSMNELYPKNIQTAIVRKMDTDLCNDNHLKQFESLQPGSKFCTTMEKEHVACKFESGGVAVDRVNELVGLLAQSKNSEDACKPPIFTNLQYYRDWIQERIEVPQDQDDYRRWVLDHMKDEERHRYEDE